MGLAQPALMHDMTFFHRMAHAAVSGIAPANSGCSDSSTGVGRDRSMLASSTALASEGLGVEVGVVLGDGAQAAMYSATDSMTDRQGLHNESSTDRPHRVRH